MNERLDKHNRESEARDWWDDDTDACTAPTVVRTQTYSRGNNDLAEMLQQQQQTKALGQILSTPGVAQYVPGWFLAALQRGSYQYETARVHAIYSVDPADCLCDNGGGCVGEVTDNASLTIRFTTPFPRGARGYVLVCGPDAKRATADRNAPGHAQKSADVQIDE